MEQLNPPPHNRYIEEYEEACHKVGFDDMFIDMCGVIVTSKHAIERYGDKWKALIEFTQLIKNSTLEDEQMLIDTAFQMAGISKSTHPCNFD